MDVMSRLTGYDGQAADTTSAYTQVKMEDAHKLLKIPKSECPAIWIRPPRHKPKTTAQYGKPSRTFYIHLDTAATNSRRESRWLSWRIRRVSSTTLWLTSGCRWSDERFLVHVRKLHLPPSRWTQSQTSLAERGIIPCSTEVHWRIQNYSYEFGCQTREAHRWLLEYWCFSRLVWSLDRVHTICSIGRKSSWRICVVRGEINEETAYIQARSSVARALEINRKARQSEGKAKVGPRKRFTLKTIENCGDSLSLTSRIKNSRKPSRTRVRSWKHQWLLQEKLWEWWIQQNSDETCVFSGSQWIHKNSCGEFWTSKTRRPYCRKKWKFITALHFCSQVYFHASAKAAVDKEWEKLEKNFGLEFGES